MSEKIWLSNLNIQNYKSISNANVDFNQGLNIIIGKNGAGKSNLLEFINYYSRHHSFLRNRVNRAKSNYVIEYSLKSSERNDPARVLIHHEKKMQKNKDGELQPANVLTIQKKVKQSQEFKYTYTYFDRNLKTEKPIPLSKIERERRAVIIDKLTFLASFDIVFVKFYLPDENNLQWLHSPASLIYNNQTGADFLDYSYFGFISQFEFKLEQLLNNKLSKKKNYDIEEIKQFVVENFYEYSHKVNIITQIRNYTPISDIRLNPNLNIYNSEEKLIFENLIIDFQINDSWVPWSYLSDGTKRLFNLVIQTVLIKNGLLLIEEPELGIHPSQLYQLLDYIKKKSFDNQVIISTHSPLVLDILPPEELKSITIAKMSKEGSKFFKLNNQKITKAIKYINDTGDLSQYWLHSDLEDD